MRILFLDRACREPYDSQMLATRGLGGSEATTIRIAAALSRWHDVEVAQGCRTAETIEGPNLRFVPLDAATLENRPQPDAVVILRQPGLVRAVRRQFPDAMLLLWLHDFLPFLSLYRSAVADARCIVVTVSRAHRDVTLREFDCGLSQRIGRWRGQLEPLDVRTVYNPIADDLQPDGTPVDPDKLVFFSSPHKGLEQVLALFAEARARRPSLRLYLANPGYLPMLFRIHERLWKSVIPGYQGHLAQEGVHVLGSLQHAEVLRHVREACCVLYAQHKFAETFGLVFAEANAVGTPVLAHDFGAAPEVLSSRRQVMDVRQQERVIERLLEWSEGKRPLVRAREEFRLSRVTGDWLALLEPAWSEGAGQKSLTSSSSR